MSHPLTHFQQNVLSVFDDDFHVLSISDIAWLLAVHPMSVGRSIKALEKTGRIKCLRFPFGDNEVEFKYHRL